MTAGMSTQPKDEQANRIFRRNEPGTKRSVKFQINFTHFLN